MNAVLAYKLRQLAAIEKMVRMKNLVWRPSYSSSPVEVAFGIAVLHCLLALAIAVIAAALFDYSGFYGFDSDQTATFAVALFSVPFVVGIFTFVRNLIQYSEGPNTWGGIISELLGRYQPLDIDAFRQLQKQSIKYGALRDDLLGAWLRCEREAIEEELRPKTLGVARFRRR